MIALKIATAVMIFVVFDVIAHVYDIALYKEVHLDLECLLSARSDPGCAPNKGHLTTTMRF